MLVRAGFMGLLVGLFVAGVGCDSLPFGKTARTEADDLSELEDADGEFAVEEEGTSDDPKPAVAKAAEMTPRLEVGQRFPLQKTVEQRILQGSPQSPPVGQSRLDLMLSLVVEQVEQANRRISVQYHRVRFAQDLGGQIVEYNSDMPTVNLTAEVLPYAGLKDNGFSFWLGPDNKVLGLVGFEQFLARCVERVPVEQQAAVVAQLQALGSEDGLANFIDDSIGLLPNPTDPQHNGKSLKVGSSWELQRRPTGPAAPETIGGANQFTTRCLLKDLTAETAEISLLGTIGPSSYVDPERQLKLTVRGGHCSGTCTVDRGTGMPTHSRIERILDMVAQLPDGTEIAQRKEVTTTIQAYLGQGASPRLAATRSGRE